MRIFFIFIFILCYYSLVSLFFFFNDTATTEIYTLSLHDALPICVSDECRKHMSNTYRCQVPRRCREVGSPRVPSGTAPDRKSTRLNSSHSSISYAVFCLKKKKKKKTKINILSNKYHRNTGST